MLILCLISLRYYGGKKQGNSEKTTYHILCMTNDRNVAYFIFKCFFFINKVVSRIRLRLLTSRLVGVILDYSQTLIFSQITLSEMDHTGSTSFQKKKKESSKSVHPVKSSEVLSFRNSSLRKSVEKWQYYLQTFNSIPKKYCLVKLNNWQVNINLTKVDQTNKFGPNQQITVKSVVRSRPKSILKMTFDQLQNHMKKRKIIIHRF